MEILEATSKASKLTTEFEEDMDLVERFELIRVQIEDIEHCAKMIIENDGVL